MTLHVPTGQAFVVRVSADEPVELSSSNPDAADVVSNGGNVFTVTPGAVGAGFVLSADGATLRGWTEDMVVTEGGDPIGDQNMTLGREAAPAPPPDESTNGTVEEAPVA